MIRRLSEFASLMIAVVSQALNNTDVTGRYFPMAGFRRALFHMVGGAMAATKTTTIAIYEATDAAGSGAQAIASASAIVTANTLVTKATVDLTAAANTDTVAINGLTFTMAAVKDVSAREFTDDDDLAECVLDATYGVPGISATAAADVATLVATVPDETPLTVVGANVAGTVTVATVEAQAFIDLDVAKLSATFTHVAAKVTTTANSNVSVGLLRSIPRVTPTQVVGASATL